MVFFKEKQTLLFISNKQPQEIMDSVNKIDEINDVKIKSIDLNIGSDLEESVCKVIIETMNNKQLEAIRQIQEIAENDELVLIKQI